MAPHFKLSEKLPTDLGSVNPFVQQVFQNILRITEIEEDVFKVKLALEEALTNAMRHGNGMDPRREVTVRIEASREKVILDVHDEGSGFDVHSLPDPTKSDYSSRPCGRGVFLMRKLMDRVDFYDRGSGIKMVKYFSLNH